MRITTASRFASRIVCRVLATLLLIATTIILLTSGTQGSTNVGVKAGLITDASVDFTGKNESTGSFDLETGQSWSVQASVELPLYSSFRSILALDYHRLGDLGKSEMILQGSFGIRYHWETRSQRFAVRPGAAVGYGYLGETSVTGSGNLILLNLSTEFIIFSESGTGFVIETAGLWSLTGGNDDYDIEAGPMFLVRAGLRF